MEDQRLSDDEGEEKHEVAVQKGAHKLKPLRKPGPTSRGHSEAEHIKFDDFCA